MKIKLKKETLDNGGLCSSSSHQGFNKENWLKLNKGEEIEVEQIPENSIGQVEEVSSGKTKKGSK